MTALSPATFRPPLRRLGSALLLGAAAGALVSAAARIPFTLGALFGATAAAIAVAARHARGRRVVADERGLRAAGGPPVDATWPELRLGFGLVQRSDGVAQRYAIFADGRGRSFGFTEPGPGLSLCRARGADGRPVEIVELRDSTLLLAIIVQRAPAWFVLPESLQVPPQAASAAEIGTEAGAAEAGEEAAPCTARPRGARLGPLALAAKLGSKLLASLGKLGAGALKAAKTANVAWAVASAATWSLLFSWKFALALMIQLFVHEYGHVYAMRRTGMKVRGLYFVPLLGAMAVTEDAFTSRRQQAYVALNGPLWGSALALPPVGLWLWTGEPIWATVAAWWALINLFNLLPIAPLDGGRVLHAFAHSYSSNLGMALSALGLVGAVALATYVGFSLIWIVAALGAMELAAESQVRTGVRALRLLPEPARFETPHWLYLRAALGAGGPRDELFLRNLARQQQAARAEPLRPLEIVAWGLAYAGLAAALVLLVWFMRHVPGAAAASGILA
jgi:Zn-dependent protease